MTQRIDKLRYRYTQRLPQVRLTCAQRDELDRRIRLSGLSAADFIRRVLLADGNPMQPPPTYLDRDAPEPRGDHGLSV